MANKTINGRIILKNDTSHNWIMNNPVLLKGEFGFENDTGKFKIGDGVSSWSTMDYISAESAVIKTTAPSSTDSSYDIGVMWLNTTTDKAYILYDNTLNNAIWKQVVTPDDLSDLGAGDMLKSAFATGAKSSQGYVDKSMISDKLTTGQNISITGDVVASGVSFDGSKAITLTAALLNVIAGGTYPKVTVNEKGLVVGFETLSATDIPSLLMSKISDAGTAATRNIGNSVGNVVVVESDGKINPSILPALSITDVFVVATQSAMLSLTAQQGDIAVRSDIGQTFILKQSPASTLANWIQLATPTDSVLSVNGQTGAITLTTSNITEGSNLYYTEARATANFNSNFSQKSSSSLTDGSSILRDVDVFILNGGTSVLS